MPGNMSLRSLGCLEDHTIWHTILDEDVQALLDKQSGVEDDEAETEGQNVITRPDLEKGAYRSLMLDHELAQFKVMIKQGLYIVGKHHQHRHQHQQHSPSPRAALGPTDSSVSLFRRGDYAKSVRGFVVGLRRPNAHGP